MADTAVLSSLALTVSVLTFTVSTSMVAHIQIVKILLNNFFFISSSPITFKPSCNLLLLYGCLLQFLLLSDIPAL